MHELATTKSIVNIVVQNATANNVKKVLGVTIVAGAIRDFDRDWMQRYYDIFSRDTIAEGAKLTLKVVPIKYHCNSCNSEFELGVSEWMAHETYECKSCGSSDTKLISGREFSVEGIEIEK